MLGTWELQVEAKPVVSKVDPITAWHGPLILHVGGPSGSKFQTSAGGRGILDSGLQPGAPPEVVIPDPFELGGLVLRVSQGALRVQNINLSVFEVSILGIRIIEIMVRGRDLMVGYLDP